MSLLVPGLGEVPVVWRPSDLTGPDSDGHIGRGGHAIRALVHHRVVGSLESMVNNTFKPTTDNELDPGERRVSSTFGIGFWTVPGGEQLRIVQFIACENTAYCNGQSPQDRAECRWDLWEDLGKPPTNEITISTEHEDNGKAGGYVVRDEIIRASIALDALLLTGDGPRIRAAGIRCNDTAAAQLGRIVPSVQTIVDHHVIAPVSKPYCWRPIGRDDGFPQARFLEALRDGDLAGGGAGEGELMGDSFDPDFPPTPGTAITTKRIGIIPSEGGEYTEVPVGYKRNVITGGSMTSGKYAGQRAYEVANPDGQPPSMGYLLASAASFTPLPVTPTHAPDCADAIAAAITADRARARIVYEES